MVLLHASVDRRARDGRLETDHGICPVEHPAASPLYTRLRRQLPPMFTGMLFAQGLKIVVGRLRAAGLDYDEHS
jgi:hypothetical protein